MDSRSTPNLGAVKGAGILRCGGRPRSRVDRYGMNDPNDGGWRTGASVECVLVLGARGHDLQGISHSLPIIGRLPAVPHSQLAIDAR